MGNSSSTDDDVVEGNESINVGIDAPYLDQFEGIETLGYRVLGVQPNSPASHAGLVSFFDFLVGANGQMLLGSGEGLEEGEEYDDVDFPALLESFKGKPLELLVWNIKSQEERLVSIIPNDDWDGAGLLGVTIRLDNYAGAEDRLIRILQVEKNSPADIAGLIQEKDYLLGTTTHSFDSTQILATILSNNIDRVVELYVYNIDSDKVRVVALMPTFSWGGNGSLGAEVGTGYIHRLPASCRNTLGGSVERKVRWVGGVTPTSIQQQAQAAVEMEPQLEMEAPDDESSSQTHLDDVSLSSQQEHKLRQEQQQKSVPAESVQKASINNAVTNTAAEEIKTTRPLQEEEDKTEAKPKITNPSSSGSAAGHASTAAEEVFSYSSPAEAYFKTTEPVTQKATTSASFPGPPLVSAPNSNPKTVTNMQAFQPPPPDNTDNGYSNTNSSKNAESSSTISSSPFVPIPPPKMSYSSS